MQYEITGACRDTGRDVTIHVNASGPDEAKALAADLNLLVASVRQQESNAPPTMQSEPGSTGANDVLTRHLSATRKGSSPDYFWLKLCGYVFSALGCLIIALTLLFNLALLLGIASWGASQSGAFGPAAAGWLITLLNMMSGFLFGALFLALGQAIIAFRDIARNSWKLRQIVELL